MSKDGSRTREFGPVPFETSKIWKTVFKEYGYDKVKRAHVAPCIWNYTIETEQESFVPLPKQATAIGRSTLRQNSN
jgi:hypothetical protein